MQIHIEALQRIEKRSKQNALPIRPEYGWIHQMRGALGLTLSKLGALCDVSTPTMAQAERREIEGKLNVETLRRAAEAMNCEFVYAFVPKSDMAEFIEKKAYEKAKRILAKADQHMTLEDQKVDRDFEERVMRLKNKLVAESKVW